jgi:hypothetical protein
MQNETGYLFLVGAPKCGTTTVAKWFGHSDQVSVARIKESKYFTNFGELMWVGPGIEQFLSVLVEDETEYHGLFERSDNVIWRMDASTDYLSCPVSAKLIHKFAHSHRVKVLVLLRDPVERIISEFQHTLRDGLQNGTLAQSLVAEERRTAQGCHPLFRHIERSRYAEQVNRYAELFDDELLVLDYHEIFQDSRILSQICAFLGVEEPNIDLSQRANERIIPQPIRNKVWKTATSLNKTVYEPTPMEITQLKEALKIEIEACVRHPLISTKNWKTALSKD